ncbi:unnamed protein product [Ixodes persulcatus]
MLPFGQLQGVEHEKTVSAQVLVQCPSLTIRPCAVFINRSCALQITKPSAKNVFFFQKSVIWHEFSRSITLF